MELRWILQMEAEAAGCKWAVKGNVTVDNPAPEVLTENELSLDEELRELRRFRRSYLFLCEVDRQLNTPIKCAYCGRDLQDREIRFRRDPDDDSVQPNCVKCYEQLHQPRSIVVSP